MKAYGKRRMYKFAALALSSLLLLAAAGCNSGQREVYDQFARESSAASESSPAPEGSGVTSGAEQGLSGELTISQRMPLLSVDIGMAAVAKEFEAQHPGVKITIQPGMTEKEVFSSDTAIYDMANQSYLEGLMVELMSGGGADIIEVGELDASTYSESGLFCDLYTLADWDKAFPEDEYYTNCLKAAEVDGSLYAMPTGVMVSCLWLNREVAELLGENLTSRKELRATDVVELYRKAVDQGLVSKSFVTDDEMTAATFVKDQFPDMLDFAEGSSSFDTPEFAALLEGIKTLKFSRTVEEGERYISSTGEYKQYDTTTRLASLGSPLQGDMVGYLTGSIQAEPYPVATEQGERLFSAEMYAINANSKQKELAWEFLYFVQSWENEAETGDSDYYSLRFSSTPLKRSLAQEKLKAELGQLYEEEFAQRMLSMVEEADTLNQYAPLFFSNLQPILADYFDRDLITAEDCAKKLQERADLYLGE